jgi:hypothetical protein
MYGTIMRGVVRPEDREALLAAVAAGERVPVPGFVGSHLMFPDGREDEVWLAVFFTDRASYERNADDPAQHQRYLAMRAFLEADPTWTDGDWQSFVPDRQG